MYDFNEVEPQRGGELIPDGSFAKVTMTIRPGGIDGQGEFDRGLLKASNQPGSDVISLDCEFTVVEGPHARRKFWQTFTVTGGKVDEKGAFIGWNISKRVFRSMIDSALGLNPEDKSNDAQAKRQLRGLADLNGITFVAKIMVAPDKDPRYSDSNKLDRPVLPTEDEWRAVMNGEDVPPSPSRPRSSNRAQTPIAHQPATWNQPQGQARPAAPGAPTPAWQTPAAPSIAQPAPTQPTATPPTPASPNGASAQPAGPAWLNG
ncbi:MAG: hypothetical protein IPM60_15725 [Rhodospirillales bacterium]|nr:hypothetical protein [Rhodospirillales bacterium]